MKRKRKNKKNKKNIKIKRLEKREDQYRRKMSDGNKKQEANQNTE